MDLRANNAFDSSLTNWYCGIFSQLKEREEERAFAMILLISLQGVFLILHKSDNQTDRIETHIIASRSSIRNRNNQKPFQSHEEFGLKNNVNSNGPTNSRLSAFGYFDNEL